MKIFKNCFFNLGRIELYLRKRFRFTKELVEFGGSDFEWDIFNIAQDFIY